MAGTSAIKSILEAKNIKIKDIASKMGIKEQVFSNKLYRNTFTLSEYIKIADILECDVKTIARDGSITITNKEDGKETDEENKTEAEQ